jgi:hypothetical protein
MGTSNTFAAPESECSTGEAVFSSATAFDVAKVSVYIGAFREILIRRVMVSSIFHRFPWRVRSGEIDQNISLKGPELLI